MTDQPTFSLNDGRTMPRFGLDAYMKRRAVTPPDFKLNIGGDVEQALELTPDEIFAVRTELLSDLHCVTTWSAVGLRWSGRRFRSFWEEVVLPHARPGHPQPQRPSPKCRSCRRSPGASDSWRTRQLDWQSESLCRPV